MCEDAFKSIAGRSNAEIRTKGSRFIGEAMPVGDEDQAEAAIASVRKREHAATHHCSAYRLGAARSVFRYNDDGEPNGTGGMPILRQIDARDLTHVLVVVTRYYGGTKLGTGGLARAYSEAADRALDAANIVTHVIFERVNVSFEYADTSPAMFTIERFDARVVDSAYSERTELAVDVPKRRVGAFADAFTEALGGRGELIRTR